MLTDDYEYFIFCKEELSDILESKYCKLCKINVVNSFNTFIVAGTENAWVNICILFDSPLYKRTVSLSTTDTIVLKLTSGIYK